MSEVPLVRPTGKADVPSLTNWSLPGTYGEFKTRGDSLCPPLSPSTPLLPSSDGPGANLALLAFKLDTHPAEQVA